MLTSSTIHRFIHEMHSKHSQKVHGLSPTNKKILNYISSEIGILNKSNLSEIDKINNMLNLLEGFYRFLQQDSIPVFLRDIEQLLVLIYYPESKDVTLHNKENLLVGKKGQTVRFWHDRYFENNREAIYNRIFDCKNVLAANKNYYEYFSKPKLEMPKAMEKKYEEMLDNAKNLKHSPSSGR